MSDQDPGPTLQEFDLLDRDDEPFKIRGRLLGFVSSQREEHSHPGGSIHDIERPDSSPSHLPPDSYAQRGERCAACRWFEVRIFEVEAELPSPPHEITRQSNGTVMIENEESPRGRYLLLTYGRSDVPGEINRRAARWTNSPYEVLEFLTQRGPRGVHLPGTSARALAQAAQYDDGINDAYVNRAVA
jgi:hypothetical protein